MITIAGLSIAGAGPAAGLVAGLHAAAGSGSFDSALAGAGPLFVAFLAIHVPAGLTAVGSGALAATARKRRGRHTRSGTVYFWAIAVVSATAIPLAALRPASDWYLAVLGTLAFTLAAAGRHIRRHPRGRLGRRWPGHVPHILAMGGSYTVMLTAFYVDNGPKLPIADRLPTAAFWLLPALVAAPLISRSAVRHRQQPAARSRRADSGSSRSAGPQ